MLPVEAEASSCIEGSPTVALVAIGRVRDKVVLAEKVDKSVPALELEGFRSGCEELLSQASSLPAQPGWTERLEVSVDVEGAHPIGYVYALADSQSLCVAIVGLRSQHCPERVAQELLDGLVRKLRTMETEERLIKAKIGKLSAATQRMLKEIIRSYRDPDKMNRVMRVYKKFDTFKNNYSDKVKSIMEKHLATETLQTHGEDMSASADMLIKQSVCRRRLGLGHQRSRKAKLALAGSVCTATSLLLLLPWAMH